MIGSLRPPGFWWKDAPSIGTAALAPLAAAYGAIAARRMAQDGFRAPVPVICIGNLTVGGAGKTPTVMAIAEQLIAAGETPWILTRGYRSAAEHHGPIRVDSKTHRAQDVGDEALLLAAIAPTLAGADRVAAAKLAAAQGASLLLLDDGFQSPAVEKDLCLVVVDAEAGIGNGLCLPAGPLRAPLEAQLDHADVLILIGEGVRGDGLATLACAREKPVLLARIEMDAEQAAALAGRRVHAFAGIGRPEKFFATLVEAGADLAATTGFPDHYAYGRDEILRLQRAAAADNALLVTTEKDFARLRVLENFIDQSLPAPLPIRVALRFAAPDALAGLVRAVIARKRLTDPVSVQAS
ncbi:MAG: tetraacyldisaccharide 4'-kinase [Methylovirgula sp.]